MMLKKWQNYSNKLVEQWHWDLNECWFAAETKTNFKKGKLFTSTFDCGVYQLVSKALVLEAKGLQFDHYYKQ